MVKKYLIKVMILILKNLKNNMLKVNLLIMKMMVLMYLYLLKKKKFDNVNNFNIIINHFCDTSASNKIPYEFKLPIASYKFYLTSINISLY